MHWGFIPVFAYGVINQVDEVEELEDITLLMNEVLFTILFLSLLSVRYFHMRTVSAAIPPLDMPGITRIENVRMYPVTKVQRSAVSISNN